MMPRITGEIVMIISNTKKNRSHKNVLGVFPFFSLSDSLEIQGCNNINTVVSVMGVEVKIMKISEQLFSDVLTIFFATKILLCISPAIFNALVYLWEAL